MSDELRAAVSRDDLAKIILAGHQDLSAGGAIARLALDRIMAAADAYAEETATQAASLALERRNAGIKQAAAAPARKPPARKPSASRGKVGT